MATSLRVRKLSPEGDYMFGQGAAEFMVDSPEAVAQCVKTRLELWAGDWFLDLDEGTPFRTKILGEGTMGLYDQAIRERILATLGVTGFDQYASSVARRNLVVICVINTDFGSAPVSVGT